MGNIMCYNIKNGGGLIRKGVFYMKNSVRLALIGVGTMGKRYAEMLEKGIEGLELAAAVARSEANRNWIAENTKCKAFASVDELFENGALFDAVLIVTPHRAHPEIAIKAFEAGKHVMCDKPAGISVTDAEKMLKAARASGKKYGMMFHNRTYPVLKKLKELLLSGRIGDVKRIILENTIYFPRLGQLAQQLDGGGRRRSYKSGSAHIRLLAVAFRYARKHICRCEVWQIQRFYGGR